MAKNPPKLHFAMRGPMGTGKSYTARTILQQHSTPEDFAKPDWEETHYFASDDFWIQDVLQEIRAKKAAGEEIDHEFYDELLKEVYRSRWTPGSVQPAHAWNFKRFKEAAEKGLTPIISDSVNTKARDMRGYVALSESLGYKVIVQEPTSPWWLDHRDMLHDKQGNGTALEDFARFLAGYHEGMNAKYGVRGNTHGVPLDVIRNVIRKWQTDLTVDDIMGRSDRKF